MRGSSLSEAGLRDNFQRQILTLMGINYLQYLDFEFNWFSHWIVCRVQNFVFPLICESHRRQTNPWFFGKVTPMLSGWDIVYSVGLSLLWCWLNNVIWFGFRKVEARLCQSISRKEIVGRKDRPHADRKPIWHLTTEPTVLMSKCCRKNECKEKELYAEVMNYLSKGFRFYEKKCYWFNQELCLVPSIMVVFIS